MRPRAAATLSPMIAGHATAEGTSAYRDRFPQLRDSQHFRRCEQAPNVGELWLSSIGLGTYLGETDDSADREYAEAIATALRSGINVLDTAINYRHQRSERNVGTALAQLIGAGALNRSEVLVCTKAGYLSFDGNLPTDPRAYFQREYIEPGILDPTQIAGGMHCMAPAYLENQIERSRRNLGLNTIDVFYVHNPESQLAEISRDVFYSRLREAFVMLEKQVAAGKLRYYGVATWGGFRVPEGSRDHLNLPDLVRLASEAGGNRHHFRFIQLPFNLAMPEAYALHNQNSGGAKMSVLSAAHELGVAVVSSATLYQGQLAHGLPRFVGQVLGLKNDAENAIQFSRSAPGMATSLVGMGHKEHVAANLKTALVPRASLEAWIQLFSAE
jgi:aryl-alcohol dehydrogenase-like predicted oxidoreductase